ncbi:MAG TPA: RNA polymerase sporulation sigma factor SigH [Acidimicrobiia bacterium]|nr:RNA polymerase sporulation sigma factor SigH [Acidimicrobiia bacterium]
MALRLDDPALSELTDETLVACFQEGDVAALNVLLDRYRGFARAKARGYFLIGADSDDIEQEGLIGLYKAARDFRPDREASFRAFAELCITRQIITAIKTATRQKHQPLNSYVSLSSTRSDDEGSERTVEESLESNEINDPADLVVSDESFRSMRTGMLEQLSGLEVRVLHLYVSGKTYQEIAGELGRHVKSIDNALQRIKRKLDAQLVERDARERGIDLDLDVAVA